GTVSAAGRFDADIAVRDLDTTTIQAPTATITANGTVSALADPAARAVTFRVEGGADGLSSDNAAIADALGRTLNLAATGSWMAGRPVTVDGARINADAIAATFAGTVGESVLGTYSLKADALDPFSALAGRDLSGAIDLNARGMVAPQGLFDLTVDATASALGLGNDRLDGLLGGNTRITGTAVRQV
ncbi:MAG: translocation/assembly module TamB, partial [Pseudomonadota bacterium]